MNPPAEIVDLGLAVPPGAVAVLTILGVPIADAVQALMFIWGAGLVVRMCWQFGCWLRRGGWREWGR